MKNTNRIDFLFGKKDLLVLFNLLRIIFSLSLSLSLLRNADKIS